VAVTKLHLPPLPGVCGKTRHHSLQVAERELQRLNAKNITFGKAHEKLAVYWCLKCKAWHVGHAREQNNGKA
jgi:hypothetical protein